MAMKIDQSPSVSTPTSSVASSGSPKVLMFGKKSGFVIPKNKLSGSLVPIFRGRGKVEASASLKENSKQVQRKTKWGLDPTQDASIRRGRALAYQTRVEQITRLLKSGAEDIGDDEGVQSPTDNGGTIQQLQNETKDFEELDMERREAIGEILCLNPGYKAPPDFKPLLKEAKVPVPHKTYPGYNFIGVLLAPENNTQKRLEEETGAFIRLFATKADTGQKVEITSSEKGEHQDLYEELYVLVSADTFEKVDAAVALIELLIAPVSGNSTAIGSSSLSAENVELSRQDAAAVYAAEGTTGIQGPLQPTMNIAQSGSRQVQPQPYASSWVPLGRVQTPHLLPPGAQFPLMPPNVYTPHPFSGVSPAMAFHSFPSPLGTGLQLPMQGLQQPANQVVPSQNPPLPNPLLQQPYPSLPAPSSSGVPLQYTVTSSMANPPASVPRPVSSMAESVLRAPPGPATAQNPPAWTGTAPVSAPLRPPSIIQTSVNSVLPPRPLLSAPHLVMPASMINNKHPIANASPSTPLAGHSVGPVSVRTPPQVGGGSLLSPPIPVPPMVSTTPVVPRPPPANISSHVLQNLSSTSQPPAMPASVSMLPPSPRTISGGLPSYSHLKPLNANPSTIQPTQIPKPQGPSSTDFTFQPLRPQPLPPSASRPINQPIVPNSFPGQQQSGMRPPAPRALPFQPAGDNMLSLPLAMNGLTRPSAASPGSYPTPSAPLVPPRPHPTLPVFHSTTLGPQIRPPGFLPTSQGNNLTGSLPFRPGDTNTIREKVVNAHSQQSANMPYPGLKPASSTSTGNQIYDPFSPS